ncbi:uncharacterized protein LOC135931333 [Gordionus sp. m RMFG-2023]|uniref:uncharacterized protein LOC135931333 n=1 Tax=Gordionus sp. m RMFG-2023 TaxID=3053472 RepID=UPI0031FDF4E1
MLELINDLNIDFDFEKESLDFGAILSFHTLSKMWIRYCLNYPEILISFINIICNFLQEDSDKTNIKFIIDKLYHPNAIIRDENRFKLLLHSLQHIPFDKLALPKMPLLNITIFYPSKIYNLQKSNQKFSSASLIVAGYRPFYINNTHKNHIINNDQVFNNQTNKTNIVNLVDIIDDNISFGEEVDEDVFINADKSIIDYDNNSHIYGIKEDYRDNKPNIVQNEHNLMSNANCDIKSLNITKKFRPPIIAEIIEPINNDVFKIRDLSFYSSLLENHCTDLIPKENPDSDSINDINKDDSSSLLINNNIICDNNSNIENTYKNLNMCLNLNTDVPINMDIDFDALIIKRDSIDVLKNKYHEKSLCFQEVDYGAPGLDMDFSYKDEDRVNAPINQSLRIGLDIDGNEENNVTAPGKFILLEESLMAREAFTNKVHQKKPPDRVDDKFGFNNENSISIASTSIYYPVEQNDTVFSFDKKEDEIIKLRHKIAYSMVVSSVNRSKTKKESAGGKNDSAKYYDLRTLPSMGKAIKSFVSLYDTVQNEKGLDLQENVCANYECCTPIGFDVEYRVCHFDGLYYCTECHINESSIIPSRIIHNWDFKFYKVCRLHKRLLEVTSRDPLIDLSQCADRLEPLLPGLKFIRRARLALHQFYLTYLINCTYPSARRFSQHPELNRYVTHNTMAMPRLPSKVDASHRAENSTRVELSCLFSVEELVHRSTTPQHRDSYCSILDAILAASRSHIARCPSCYDTRVACSNCNVAYIRIQNKHVDNMIDIGDTYDTGLFMGQLVRPLCDKCRSLL